MIVQAAQRQLAAAVSRRSGRRCHGTSTRTASRSFSASASSALEENDNAPCAYYDVAIVGGGVVGSSLANQLSKRMPGLKVALLERGGGPSNMQSFQNSSQRVPNPRSYALSPASLKTLGSSITSKLPLGEYDSMQVWQENSPACLTFTSNDLDGGSVDDNTSPKFLGACCEDAPIVAALWEELRLSSNVIDLKTNTQLTFMECGDASNLATVQLIQTEDSDDNNTTQQQQSQQQPQSQQQQLQASVLIGADGGNSWIRQTAGIDRIGDMYGLSALTFTVKLDKNQSMNGRAFQRFLAPDGSPMALLPTFSENHAVVVWSTAPETVQQWKDASESDLVDFLNVSLQEGPQRIPSLLENERVSSSLPSSSILSNLIYGAERVVDTVQYGLAMSAAQELNDIFRVPPRITSVESPKFTFSLSCFQATSYNKGRVALVGDAAHTVHPMAGQGLNLGLGDVEVLVQCLQDNYQAGMDLSLSLDEYNRRRKQSVSISLGGIHALQRMFQSQHPLPQHMKTFGMNMIQTISPLRKQLAKAAAHGV